MLGGEREAAPVAARELLGLADRFLTLALFDGELLLVTGYLIDTAVLVAIALTAHRMAQARKMVSQYPWLYRRVGLFGWRRRGPETGSTRPAVDGRRREPV